MDFQSHHQQQSNSSNHLIHQQQSHNAVVTDQLPNEDVIEKLFPKCQPKQKLQQQRSSRSDHSYLQNRNSQQRQQQNPDQQHRRTTVRSHKVQQHSRKELEARRNRALDKVDHQESNRLPFSRRAQRSQQNNSFRDSKNSKANQYQSTDSSDEQSARDHPKSVSESKAATVLSTTTGDRKYSNLQQTAAGTKTAGSVSYPCDKNCKDILGKSDTARGESDSGQLDRVPRLHRGGRKYAPSKNLQEQVQKASHGSKVYSQSLIQLNQSPLINLSSSERNSASAQDDCHPSAQQQNPGSQRQSISDKDKQTSTTKQNLDGNSNLRATQKNVNRTSRGVVFLVRDDENEKINHVPLIDPDEDKNNEATINFDDTNVEKNPLIAERPLIPSVRGQAVDSEQPADYLRSGAQLEAVSKNDSSEVAESILEPDESRQFSLNPQESATATSDVNNTQQKASQKDDDKYIDLFVYDNSPTHCFEEKPEDSPTSREDRIKLDTPILEPHGSEVISLQNHPSQRLLAPDQVGNDDTLVRNDTSVEELCDVGEYSDDFMLKFSQPRPGKTTDTIPHSKTSASELSNLVCSKPILKHHRSLGTLQTVDEKAEIIEESAIEEDGLDRHYEMGLNDSNGAMQSRNDTYRKGFLPPGFPQRVRPQFSENHRQQPGNTAQNHAASPTSSSHPPKKPVSIVDNKIDSPTNQIEEKAPKLISSPVNILDSGEAISNTIDTDICTDGGKCAEKDFDLNKLTINDPNDENCSSNPRHHKLPNESSHFSVVRATESRRDFEQNPNDQLSLRREVPFGSLSCDESDSEVKEINYNPTLTMKILEEPVKIPSPPASNPIKNVSTSHSTTVQPRESPADGSPVAKSALIFPRLDEGLSSEAESCDDYVEYDDDRAMEADVDDADDDDADDNTDDNAETSSNHAIDRGSSILQNRADLFARHQQVKRKSRLINSLQTSSSTEIDNQHAKQAVPAFGNYTSQELIDNDDSKSQSILNQNGQSNYWLGTSNQPTTSQPSSSHQFHPQRGNQSMVNNANKTPLNRDEVKSTSRISSDTDNETDRLLGSQRNDQLQKTSNNDSNSGSIESQTSNNFTKQQQASSREVLIEGVLFNVRYLGSTHTECEGRGEKEDRINQAEMAVHEVKFRNGDSSSSIEVQLFISTEKIMVLDDKHRKIMMDHSLRTISYIADIGNAIVLIVRKKSNSLDPANEVTRAIPKTTCHVFESHESHTITKSISQAFQVAYTELLKANGGDAGNYLPKELDYQEVLNSQEMSMTELEMFARKDNQREVIVPKQKGEILGLSIVESGWGSVLPTAVIASLKQDGPAYRCKKLSVGDQILSINGISLVGLSLAECQEILRKTRNQRVARLSVVPCPITVEVKIKRPDTKYQLGFSVQNGVICSLLRGGIAERGGVRVGHRIMSINGTTVVGVPHDKIVTLLASSVGEIRMKTCLTSLYRHMLGEEKAVFL